MALSTVTLKWNLTDLVQGGQTATLVITPSAQMADSTDHVLVAQPVPRRVVFSGGQGQLAGIIANDNSSILPTGTGYTIQVVTSTGAVIVPAFTTQLLTANGATQWLDQLAPVSAVTTGYLFLPLPSGTATAGYVPVATGSGEATTWQAQSGGGGGGAVSSVFTRTGAVVAGSGDYTVSQVTGAAPLASPALTGTPTAPTAAALADSTQIATTAYTDSAVAIETTRAEAAEASKLASLTAADTSAVVGGTATAPTVRTNTLDVIATTHPPAAAWSNNHHQINAVANGAASSDAAAFGQIATAVAVETARAEAAEVLLQPLALPSATVSASGSFSAAHQLYLVSCASGNLALTCPSPAAVTGIPFTFKRTDSTTNTLEFLPFAAELIDGATTAWLPNSAAELALVSDGTNWWTL